MSKFKNIKVYRGEGGPKNITYGGGTDDGMGIFYVDNLDMAGWFAGIKKYDDNSGKYKSVRGPGKVITETIFFTNPYIFEQGFNHGEIDSFNSYMLEIKRLGGVEKYRKDLISKGHDGIILKNNDTNYYGDDPYNIYIKFKAEDMKTKPVKEKLEHGGPVSDTVDTLDDYLESIKLPSITSLGISKQEDDYIAAKAAIESDPVLFAAWKRIIVKSVDGFLSRSFNRDGMFAEAKKYIAGNSDFWDILRNKKNLNLDPEHMDPRYVDWMKKLLVSGIYGDFALDNRAWNAYLPENLKEEINTAGIARGKKKFAYLFSKSSIMEKGGNIQLHDNIELIATKPIRVFVEKNYANLPLEKTNIGKIPAERREDISWKGCYYTIRPGESFKFRTSNYWDQSHFILSTGNNFTIWTADPAKYVIEDLEIKLNENQYRKYEKGGQIQYRDIQEAEDKSSGLKDKMEKMQEQCTKSINMAYLDWQQGRIAAQKEFNTDLDRLVKKHFNVNTRVNRVTEQESSLNNSHIHWSYDNERDNPKGTPGPRFISEAIVFSSTYHGGAKSEHNPSLILFSGKGAPQRKDILLSKEDTPADVIKKLLKYKDHLIQYAGEGILKTKMETGGKIDTRGKVRGVKPGEIFHEGDKFEIVKGYNNRPFDLTFNSYINSSTGGNPGRDREIPVGESIIFDQQAADGQVWFFYNGERGFSESGDLRNMVIAGVIKPAATSESEKMETGGQLKEPDVADIIVQQLGKLTLMMLGAYNLVKSTKENWLSFRIKGSRKVNYIKITLKWDDTYTMEFGKIKNVDPEKAMSMTPEQYRAAGYQVVKEVPGVYAEDMHSLIEENTELYTHFAAGGKVDNSINGIDDYYAAAKSADDEGLIDDLSKLEDSREDGIIGKKFSFHHKSDNCEVIVYEEVSSGSIVMTQSYNDDNPAEDDDISLDGFVKYLKGADDYGNDGLRHALLETVSAGTISSMTNLRKYKDIDGVRTTAIQMLNRDGDQKYSLDALKTLLQDAVYEWKENEAEFAYNRSKYADGGNILQDGKKEIVYVMDSNGRPKNLSTNYKDAKDFLWNSLKGNGSIGYAYVDKQAWDNEKITTSNIKSFGDGGQASSNEPLGVKKNIQQIIAQKGYGPVHDSIKKSIRDLKNAQYTKAEILDTIEESFGTHFLDFAKANYAEGGNVSPEKTKSFWFKDGSGFHVRFIDKDGKLFPELIDTLLQDNVTAAFMGKKSLAEIALGKGKENDMPFNKILETMIKNKLVSFNGSEKYYDSVAKKEEGGVVDNTAVKDIVDQTNWDLLLPAEKQEIIDDIKAGKLMEHGGPVAGIKKFIRQDNIGTARYTVSYHDGIDKHDDGSEFWGIRLFGNKVELKKYIDSLLKQGYVDYTGRVVMGDGGSIIENTDTRHSSAYDIWEGDVIDELEEQLEMDRSDAQGLVMANEFYMAQSWSKGLSAKDTAKLIDEKSRVKHARGGKVKLPAKYSPEWHQLQVAKKTIKMTPAMAQIMGGQSYEEAQAVLEKYGLKFEKGGSIAQFKIGDRVTFDTDKKDNFIKETSGDSREIRQYQRIVLGGINQVGEVIADGPGDGLVTVRYPDGWDVPMPKKYLVILPSDDDSFEPVKKSDITEGSRFMFGNGTIFIIDKITGDSVSSSYEGGAKGNFRDPINDVVSFFNEERARKMPTSTSKEVVIETTGGSGLIPAAYQLSDARTYGAIDNMFFDNEEQARDYADKKGLVIIDKFYEDGGTIDGEKVYINKEDGYNSKYWVGKNTKGMWTVFSESDKWHKRDEFPPPSATSKGGFEDFATATKMAKILAGVDISEDQAFAEHERNFFKSGGRLAPGSADNDIVHIYQHRDKLTNEALSKFTLPVKRAFGGFYIDIDDVFKETGPDSLKYKFVGYGGVVFLGNINGKTAGNLYYKSEKIKKETETLCRTLQSINDDVAEAIEVVHKDKGRPKIQHAILSAMARNAFRFGGKAKMSAQSDAVLAARKALNKNRKSRSAVKK